MSGLIPATVNGEEKFIHPDGFFPHWKLGDGVKMIDGKDAWDEQHFGRVIKSAGFTIECSWGVTVAVDRKTGEKQVLLLFNDDEKDNFSYAFGFRNAEEIAHLVMNLFMAAKKLEAPTPTPPEPPVEQ